MPFSINAQTYYRTAEVCRMVGISRSTLFRWLKEGIVIDVEYRDWRGWRLFTSDQIETIRTKSSHITVIIGEAEGIAT